MSSLSPSTRSDLQTNSYRPDIDGLRAVAVLSVLLFHGFPQLMPGGFLGVDVFFVISGYLITRIIKADLDQGHFSLKRFYVRRVLRIFPALCLILVFVFVLGWIALTAGEYKQLGKYIAGGAAFLNNVLFWRDAGYFDSAADTKPLLHLWSLAIEEQFYLIWPLLLLAMARLCKNNLKILWLGVFSLLSLSLGYSLWLVQRDATADFYSPWSRAWELLMGAGLALHRGKIKWSSNEHICRFQPYKQGTSALGMVLIFIGFFWVRANFAFPGAWALLPCLGAALLIHSDQGGWFNQKILSHPVLVGIGLISYPLYLWHWPLLSFARIFEGTTPSSIVRICLLMLSFLLAWATYHLLEKPLRSAAANARNKRFILTCLCAVMVILFCAGYAINRNEGLKFRHYDRLEADASTMVLGHDRDELRPGCGDESLERRLEWCKHQNKLWPATHVMLGDSKAEAAFYGLVRHVPADQHWVLMGSFPTFALESGFAHQPTSLFALAVNRVLQDPHVKTVVLASSFRHIFAATKVTGIIEKPSTPEQIEALMQAQNLVIQLLQKAGKQVVFWVDNPTLPDPNSCIRGDLTSWPWINQVIYRKENPYCRITYAHHLSATQDYQTFIRTLATANPQMRLFDPTTLLCDTLAQVCRYHEGRNYLYSYGDHISDYANSKLAKYFYELPLAPKQ